jgi:hypothetical protein
MAEQLARTIEGPSAERAAERSEFEHLEHWFGG